MIMEKWDVDKLLKCFPGDCYTVHLLKGDGESEWLEYDNSYKVPDQLRGRKVESFKMFVDYNSAIYIIYS